MFRVSAWVWIELDHHIWIRESPQIRSIPHFDPKSLDIMYMGHLTNMLFNIYSCIQRRNLTHTWHINMSLLSARLFIFVTWWDSLIKSEAQHGEKGGLVTVLKEGCFFFISFMRREKVNYKKKEDKKGIWT